MTDASRIVVEEHLGHWTARFENQPHEGWGGDTPGTAVERVWEAHLNTLAARKENPPAGTG